MDWPDAIEESLPAPRDDEPAHLRRDIADELQDHLNCAMDREIRKTPDNETAQAAVLKQFGSPTQIARRLWWDAMKEKIMSQRLTLAATGIAMAACLGVFVLSWTMFEDSRKVNLAIVTKLESLTSQQPAEQSLEWTSVTFRCVEETEDGPPAEGFRVELNGNPINSGSKNSMTLKEAVDSHGTVKFGPIRPGPYSYVVYSPWNMRARGHLVALPGRRTEEAILCPTTPTPKGPVKFDIKWPNGLKEALKQQKDLDADDLWLQCRFQRFGEQSTIAIGEHDWTMPWESFGVIIKSDGALVLAAELLNLQMAQRSGFAGSPMGIPARKGRLIAAPAMLTAGTLSSNRAITTTVDVNQLASAEDVKWPIGDYCLMQVVLLSHETDPTNADSEIVTALAGHGLYSSEEPRLQVRADSENKWTIELPVIDLNQSQSTRNGLRGGGVLPRGRGLGRTGASAR